MTSILSTVCNKYADYYKPLVNAYHDAKDYCAENYLTTTIGRIAKLSLEGLKKGIDLINGLNDLTIIIVFGFSLMLLMIPLITACPEDEAPKHWISLIVSPLIVPLIVYYHEAAHAFATKLLFKNVKSQIILKSWGFEGGFHRKKFKIEQSSFSPVSKFKRAHFLSSVGNILGINTSDSLVAAAGPTASNIAYASLGLLINAKWISPTILGVLVPQVTNSCICAISPLFEDREDLSNDFCCVLRKSGVIAYGILALTTLFTTAAVYYFSIPIAGVIYAKLI
jgi:hypothetical protein